MAKYERQLYDLVEETIGGLWGRPLNSRDPNHTEVLVLRGADFRAWETRRGLDAAPRRIPTKALARRQLAPGDLVLEVSGGSPAQPVGRVLVIDDEAMKLADKPLICSNFCRKIRLVPDVNPFFIKRQLDSLYQLGHTQQYQTSTTNIRNLRVDDFIRGTHVVVPDLCEQTAIMKVLDGIETHGASIAHRLAAARAIVARLRTAVLAAACSGRLTIDWRDEHGTPPSGSPNGPPPTWKPTRLGDIVRIATGATPLRKNAAYYEGGTIPWVTSGAVNAGIISEPTELITPRALAETNVKLFPPGTLLIAMYGEGQTRGRVAELAIEAGTNQALAAIVFDKASAPFKPYLRLFFEDGYQRMRATSLGGVQPNLNLGMFKETVLPLPPLEEQREIVNRANVALATSDRLSAAITSAERSLGDASRAALRRAFRGDLGRTEAGGVITGNEPAHEEADGSAVGIP